MRESQHIAATTVAAKKAAQDGKSITESWIAYGAGLPLTMNIQEREELLTVFRKAHAIVSANKEAK